MRFFKPESKEYISDFVPQDINAIYKMKQSLDVDAEKTETAIAVSQNAFNLKPGEMTGPLANDLNKMYQDESQKIADNYYSGNINESTTRVQIAKLTNHFNNNPEVQTVQFDNELIPVASALRANPLFGDYGISEGKDPQTGNWKPVKKSMTRAELQDAYKTYFPGDGFKELSPVLNSIMPDVVEGNTSFEGYEQGKTTALGEGLYNVKTSSGWKTVKLDENKVRREIHGWVDANWERNNYEHYVYGRKSGDFNTPMDWENYIVNQFVGSRNDISSSGGKSINPAIKPGSKTDEEENQLVPEGGIVSSPMGDILGDNYNNLKKSGFVTDDGIFDFEKLAEPSSVWKINGVNYTMDDINNENLPSGYKPKDIHGQYGLEQGIEGPGGVIIKSKIENKAEKEKQASEMMNKIKIALGSEKLVELGINPNKIVPSKDWPIMSLAFNELSKTKGFGVQMTNASRDLINEKIANNGLGDYTVSVNDGPFEDHQKMSDDATNALYGEGKKIIVRNRISKKGYGNENILQGEVLDENNKFLATVDLKPKNEAENNYFKNMKLVEDKSIAFMTTGDFVQFANKDDRKLYSKETIKNTMNKNAEAYIQKLVNAYGKSKLEAIMNALNIDPNNEEAKKNILLLDRTVMGDGKTFVYTYVNANNPSNIIYINSEGRVFNSIGELKVNLDSKWYRTNSGLGRGTKDFEKTEGEK